MDSLSFPLHAIPYWPRAICTRQDEMEQMERDQWQFAAWKTSGFLLSTRGLSSMCPLKSETIKIVNFNLFQRHSMDASTSVLVSGISPVLVAVSNLEIYWPHIGGCRCLICRVLWCGQSQWPRLVAQYTANPSLSFDSIHPFNPT